MRENVPTSINKIQCKQWMLGCLLTYLDVFVCIIFPQFCFSPSALYHYFRGELNGTAFALASQNLGLQRGVPAGETFSYLAYLGGVAPSELPSRLLCRQPRVLRSPAAAAAAQPGRESIN